MKRLRHRRNAVLGWFAWRAVKRTARKRVRRRDRHLLRYVGIGSILTLVVSAAVIGRSRPTSIG